MISTIALPWLGGIKRLTMSARSREKTALRRIAAATDAGRHLAASLADLHPLE
ncbi:MAG: hypothetical protein WD875_07705 [Pirellulales bacterium]